ncbi:hypothetical protein ACMDCT_08075 [Halomonadaceae bacterium KBTZ08]
MMPGDQFPGFGHDAAAGGGGLGGADVEGDRGLGARKLDAGEGNQPPRLREDQLIVGIDQPADMVGRHVGDEG